MASSSYSQQSDRTILLKWQKFKPAVAVCFGDLLLGLLLLRLGVSMTPSLVDAWVTLVRESGSFVV